MSDPVLSSSVAQPEVPRQEFGHEGSAPSTQSFYLPQLDILRFFAFFAVFSVHVAPRAMGSGRGIVVGLARSGTFGVDLFFALSAYLITELLLRERRIAGHLDVRSFYIRRILRIWPLYFFYLALAFCFSRLEFALT